MTGQIESGSGLCRASEIIPPTHTPHLQLPQSRREHNVERKNSQGGRRFRAGIPEKNRLWNSSQREAPIFWPGAPKADRDVWQSLPCRVQVSLWVRDWCMSILPPKAVFTAVILCWYIQHGEASRGSLVSTLQHQKQAHEAWWSEIAQRSETHSSILAYGESHEKNLVGYSS